MVIAASDILIGTSVRRVETDLGFADQAGPVAGIRATGNITLQATDSIGLAGVDLRAGRDVTLLAGGNLNLGAIRLESELGNRQSSNYDYLRSTTHRTTGLTAGGNISLMSSGISPDEDGRADVILSGSDLTAGGAVAITAAQGNVLLLAVNDEHYTDRARSASSLFGLNKKTSREQLYSLTPETVTIAADRIDILAGGSVLAEGTSFEASGLSGQEVVDSGRLAITAQSGTIEFTAVETLTAERHERSSSLLGGLISRSSTREDVLSDMEGVQVTTTGDLDLSAVQGSVLMQGGAFGIGGDLNVETGTVYLQGIIDSRYSFEQSNDNNGFTITDETRVTLTETVDAPRISTGGSNGLLDPQGPAVRLGGRGEEGAQFVRGSTIDALGPQGVLAAAAGGTDGSQGGEDASGGPHWTETLAGQYSDSSDFRTASFDDVRGPGTDYLAALRAEDSTRVTLGAETTLLDIDHYEKSVQAGVITKAIIAIASQGMGLGTWGTFALNTALLQKSAA